MGFCFSSDMKLVLNFNFFILKKYKIKYRNKKSFLIFSFLHFDDNKNLFFNRDRARDLGNQLDFTAFK